MNEDVQEQYSTVSQLDSPPDGDLFSDRAVVRKCIPAKSIPDPVSNCRPHFGLWQPSESHSSHTRSQK
eukprot:214025-Pyramimonas_sp.AAC.1